MPFQIGHKINIGNKFGVTNKGHLVSIKTREKISKANKGHKFYGGKQGWFKKGHKIGLGKPRSEATKEKLRKYKGDKTSNWKGGISKDKKRYKRIRRNREHNVIGSHTKKEWEILCKKWGDTCACCRKIKKLTEDHIIPISLGGTDFIENIQPLCISCNSKKHTKIIKYKQHAKNLL